MHLSLQHNSILVFCVSFLLVFLGDRLYVLLNRKKQKLTNFQRFLFGTGFAYLVTVCAELVKFFFDFYRAGSYLQGYDLDHWPAEPMLFFKVFGHGVWLDDEANRFRTLQLDLTFFYMMLGAALGGLVLVVLTEIASRKKQDDAGMLYGYRFEKLSFGKYLKREFQTYRETLPLPEYILWWLVRGAMVWGIIHLQKTDPRPIETVMMLVNLVVTFIIPVVRFLFFSKLFFGKLPLRVQTWIDVFVFTGSFLGHGLGWSHRISSTSFDKLQHVISGGLTIFIGYELICCTRKSKKLSKTTKVLGATGFSFVVMIVWEIFEFLSDFLLLDSINQNPNYEPAPDMFFFKIFGAGAGNPGHSALLDTNIDLVCAAAGCAACILILVVFLQIKERLDKKKAAKAETEAEKEAEKEKSAVTA